MSIREYFVVCVLFCMGIHTSLTAQTQTAESYISSVSWIGNQDSDGDFFNRWAVLSVDADLKTDTTDFVTFKLYCKKAGSLSYDLLSTSELISLTATSYNDAFIFDTIKNLSAGLYDFKVEVYDKNEKLSDSVSAFQTAELAEIGFELTENDPPKEHDLFFYSLGFAQSVDNDSDSYSPYRWLKIDLDAKSNDTSLVYCKVYYKTRAEKEYRLHWKSNLDSVYGDAATDAFIDTLTNLTTDLYDFKVEVYNNKDSLLLSNDSLVRPQLSKVGFESFAEDGKTDSLPKIYSIGFIDYTLVDQDKDGWVESGSLYIDLDMPVGFSDSFYFKLYYRPQATTSYSLYKTTEPKQVIGSLSNDAQIITISGLSHGYYQCKLEVYRTDNTLVGTLEADDTQILDSLPFELPVSSQKPEIASCTWSRSIDLDGDHFTQSRTIVVDANCDGVYASVFAKIFYKTTTSNEYSILGSTKSVVLSGNALADTMVYVISDLPTGSYDFEIKLYAEDGTLLCTYENADHTNMSALQFEPIKDDEVQTSKAAIVSAAWSLVEDKDSDRFARSRTLSFDPNVSTGSQELHADIYYKLSSADTYSLLQSTSTSTISGAATTDKVTVPLANIAHGVYDFKICLLTNTNQLVDVYDKTDEPALGSVSFEIASDDAVQAKQPLIASLEWISGIDNDADKIYQTRTIKLDVDLPDSTASLYAFFSYKNNNSSSYTALTKKLMLNITNSTSDDAASFVIEDFPNGVYDFKIDIYNSFGQTVLSCDSVTQPVLANIPFESAANDNVASTSKAFIASAVWASIIDKDDDSFAQSRVLTFDPNITEGAVSAVAKIYFKQSNATDYNLLGSSNAFPISGMATTDVQSFLVSNLPSGTYDFKIDLVVSNVSNDIYDLQDNTLLQAVKFESSTNDIALSSTPKIAALSWNNGVDNNKNMFTQSRVLSVSTSLQSGNAKVYAKVLYKTLDETTFAGLETSQIQSITSTNTSEPLTVTISGLKHAKYDFKVQLCTENGDVVDSVSFANNALVAAVPFETLVEDGKPTDARSIAAFELSVYPNPATDKVLIETPSDEMVFVQLISSTGQIVRQQSFVRQLLIENLDNLSGVYVLSITSTTNSYVQTIIFD